MLRLLTNNKAAAETANSSVQELAPTIAASAAQVAADRVLTQSARDQALQVIVDTIPIAQSALVVTGNGIVIGPGAGFDAGLSAGNGLARKPTGAQAVIIAF